MTVEIQVHDRIAPIAAEWDDLADRTGATPFHRPGWIGPWLEIFAASRWELLALRRDGRLAAIMPLHTWPGDRATMTNWVSPETGFLAEDEEAAVDLATALFARGYPSVALYFVDFTDMGPAESRAAATASAYRTIEQSSLTRSPYVRIESDWPAYERSLDTVFRRNLRRRSRRLHEQGEVRVEITDGGSQPEPLVEEGFAVEASGWKGDLGVAIALREDRHQFYTEVARWAAARGMLRLAFLRLDGEPLAFLFALEDKDCLYALESGYDSAFKRFSPSSLLLRAWLERAFGLGLRQFELGGPPEPYKLQWSLGACHRLTVLRAFAPSLRGRLEWWTFAQIWPLARRIPLLARLGKLVRRRRALRAGSLGPVGGEPTERGQRSGASA